MEQEHSPRANRTFFQAYDSELAQAVSIVPVRSDAVSGRSVLTFEQLTAALIRFRHAYALGLRDSFVHDGVHHIVTDLIDGPDMASVLAEQENPFPVPQVTAWGESLLEVLHALHTFRPVTIFQEVCPEAMIMRPDGELALLLSEMFNGAPGTVGTIPPRTSNRSIAYAPLEKIWVGLDAASQKVIIKQYDETSERLLKQEMDPRSDIFSLGAALYHLITARQPVDALERSIEMIDGKPDPLESPHNIDPSIPVEVSDVIMKAMEIKRECRFDSAAIMRQVLRTAVVRAMERGIDISDAPNQIKVDGGGSKKGAGVSVEPTKLSAGTLAKSAVPDAGKPAAFVTQDDAEDDLLGIFTPVPPPQSAKSQSVSAAFPSKNVSMPAEVPTAAGPAVEKSKESADIALSPNDEPELSIFSEPPPRSSRGLVFAAAAVVLCVAVGGGWFYFGKTTAPTAPPPVVEQTQKPEGQAVTQVRPNPSPEPAASPEVVVQSTEVPAEGPDTPVSGRVEPARPRKQVAQAPKPVQKKAVTVDDLINDN